MLPSSNKYSERESNPIPKSICTYLSGSAFLVHLTSTKNLVTMYLIHKQQKNIKLLKV